MKITRIKTTPLFVPFKEAYHWSLGVDDGATMVLVEVETDEGITGIGECVGWPTVEAVTSVLQSVSPVFIGELPFDIQRLIRDARYLNFLGSHTPRFANQSLTGLEMALWDIVGKAAGQPVHRLLGGAVRKEIEYFAFLQGDTAEDLAEDAREFVAANYPVIYFKIGRGEERDIRNVAAVREVIGERRLRLDANEAWDTLTAIRMIRKLSRFDPEFIEQPTPAFSIDALAHVKASVDIPIAADQAVFTPSDVSEVCKRRAADVIVLGIHESGGLLGYKKAATVAEVAGVNLCIHGIYETGITTCAVNQVASTIPNLDDGNQIMCQLLVEDIIASPRLEIVAGRMGVVDGVGLGFELDGDAVARAAERYRKRIGPAFTKPG